MGKDKSLRAFHNVCRHRAFPVVKKQSGSSLILGCKYHGWCYDTTGALTKAPQFDTVSGFDPAQNALFPIALHLDEPSGLVFVCMDNGRNGDVPSFSEFFGELDGSLPNLAEFTHYADYSVEGDLNWKSKSPDADSGLLGTHSIKFTPRTPGPEPLKQSDGPSLNGGLMKSLGLGASSNPNRSPTSPASGIFFYPNATLSIHSTGFYISRSNPLGPTKSSINCEIYVTKGATKEDSDSFLDFVKSSERSSVEASSALQAGLVEGSAVPRTGMLAFKDEAKKTLEKWAAMEKERGRDINAAGFEGEDEEEDGIGGSFRGAGIGGPKRC